MLFLANNYFYIPTRQFFTSKPQVNGKAHGHGVMDYSNGDKYEGDWKDNKIHGKGKLTCAGGGVYEGYWKDGKKGKGKTTFWKDGMRYA